MADSAAKPRVTAVGSIAHEYLRNLALAAPVILAALHPLVFILQSHSTSHHFACDAIARPTLGIIGVALLALLLLRRITGDVRFASVAGTFFFVILGLFPFLFTGEDAYSWPLYAGFLAASVAMALGLARLLDGLVGVVISWVLGVVVMWTAISAYATSAAVWPEPPWRDQVDQLIARAESITVHAPRKQPDIYYIVLDGLARVDVLESMYGLQARQSVGELEALGVQIPRRSRSNYAQTQLSLASALNIQYLDELAAVMGDRFDRRPLIRLIADAGAVTALRRRGYDVVVVKSGTSIGTHRESGCRFSNLPPGPTELELALLKRLPVPNSFFHRATLRAHRHQVMRSFDAIEDAASDRPMLVVAHVVSPHPPFVIGEDGNERLGQDYFTFIDGDAFPGSRGQYIAGYRAQAAFVLRRIARVVQRIVARSPGSYIIIHSDHGPGLGLVNTDAERTDAFERLSIFSAYYAGGDVAPVPDTMSPVNALRWALRHALDADVPLLEDRSYLSDYLHPYRLTEIAPERPQPGAR